MMGAGASSWRGLLKRSAGALLWPLAAPAAARRSGGRRGLILMFHYVGAPILPGAHDFLFLAPPVYESILDFVVAHLHPLPPAEFFQRMQAGDLPPRATLLTFDDGTRDNVTAALPPLAARGLSACFFVSPGLMAAGCSVPSLDLADLVQRAAPDLYTWDASAFLGRPTPPWRLHLGDAPSRAAAFRGQLLPLLMAAPSWRRGELLAALGELLHAPAGLPPSYPLAGWAELAELVAAGNLVGSHTLWHSTLAADGPERFAADLADSLAEIEAHFPAGPRVFCFPYGRAQDAPPAAAGMLAAAGVEFALVVQGGMADLAAQGPYFLRREAVNYSAAALKLSALRAWLAAAP